MDAGVVIVALAGAAAGLVASAIPGLHVNALSALLLAAAPAAGEPGVVFLVAAFAASPFGLALSSPLVGAGSDDAALSGPPALRLASEGRAVEAVALQCWGAFAGIVVALPIALAAGGALVLVAPVVLDAMKWLLVAILALLLWTEPCRPPTRRERVVVAWKGPTTRLLRGRLSRGRVVRIGRLRVEDPDDLLAPFADGATIEARVEERWVAGAWSRAAGVGLALVVLGLSGALGLVAFRLGASSPFGLPASPLLPLLAGLFAAPALVLALRARKAHRRPAGRAPRPRRGDWWRAAIPGAAVSAAVGLAPGVTASHAALLAPRARSVEARLVRLSAVTGGAVVFTLLAWHALGKARSGALVSAGALAPVEPWRTWMPSPALLEECALVLLAAGAACLLARSLSAPLARKASRVRPARLALAGLLVLGASVAAFTGALGLAVLAIAALVGALPIRWRVRRSHLMGVILVPALLRAWGIAIG